MAYLKDSPLPPIGKILTEPKKRFRFPYVMARQPTLKPLLLLWMFVIGFAVILVFGGCKSTGTRSPSVELGSDGSVRAEGSNRDIELDDVRLRTPSGFEFAADKVKITNNPEQTRAEGDKASRIIDSTGEAGGTLGGTAARRILTP